MRRSLLAATVALSPLAALAAAPMMQLQSTLTCPSCGHPSTEAMPTDACHFFYECKGCGALLKPNPGDCCVFCSYGDVPCPPVQEAKQRCQAADFCSDA